MTEFVKFISPTLPRKDTPLLGDNVQLAELSENNSCISFTTVVAVLCYNARCCLYVIKDITGEVIAVKRQYANGKPFWTEVVDCSPEDVIAEC